MHTHTHTHTQMTAHRNLRSKKIRANRASSKASRLFLKKWSKQHHSKNVTEGGGDDLGEWMFFDSAASSCLSESYSHRPTNCCVGTSRVWTPNLSALDSPGWHNHYLTTSSQSSYILPITLQHLHDTFISTYLHIHCIPHPKNSEVCCQYTPLQSNIHVSKGHCSSAITPWFWTIPLLRSNYSSRSSQKERNSNSLVTIVDTRLLLLLKGGKPNNSRCVCPLTFLSEYLTRLTEAVYGVWIPILGALPK